MTLSHLSEPPRFPGTLLLDWTLVSKAGEFVSNKNGHTILGGRDTTYEKMSSYCVLSDFLEARFARFYLVYPHVVVQLLLTLKHHITKFTV